MSRARVEASPSANEGGFTLLETVAAMAVFTLVASALLTGLLTAVRRSEQANFMMIATELARSKLAAAGVDFPLTPGVASGGYANGFSWRADVAALSRAAPGGAAFYDVRITISEAMRGRAFVLHSVESDQ